MELETTELIKLDGDWSLDPSVFGPDCFKYTANPGGVSSASFSIEWSTTEARNTYTKLVEVWQAMEPAYHGLSCLEPPFVPVYTDAVTVIARGLDGEIARWLKSYLVLDVYTLYPHLHALWTNLGEKDELRYNIAKALQLQGELAKAKKFGFGGVDFKPAKKPALRPTVEDSIVAKCTDLHVVDLVEYHRQIKAMIPISIIARICETVKNAHVDELKQRLKDHMVNKWHARHCSVACFVYGSFLHGKVSFDDILKSQKARGLWELTRQFPILNASFGEISVLRFEHAASDVDIDLVWNHHYEPEWFGRPCPPMPVHGFVDSRVVKTAQEAKLLLLEAQNAVTRMHYVEKHGSDHGLDDASCDCSIPRAELLLCPFISAAYNMVWSNGSLTIGVGNDGATAGRDCITIPTMNWTAKWDTIKGSPFIEMVVPNGDRKVILTQLRDGPAVPTSGNFIPARTVVKQVELADGDLLEWMEKVQKFGPGTVVYQPNGSLSNHYAVHCILHNIPFVIEGNRPEAGDVLKPTSKQKKKIDIDAFKIGVKYALVSGIEPDQAAALVLVVLHNFSGYDLSNGWHARLAGFACGLTCRMGFLASVGEARHYRRAEQDGLASKIGENRNRVYQRNWPLWKSLVAYAEPVLMAFLDYSYWHDGGYGGRNWAICLYETIKLWNKLVDVVVRKKPDMVKDAISCLNVVINTAHNHGKYLNKFLDDPEFDRAAKFPVFFAFTHLARLLPWLRLLASAKANPALRLKAIELPNDCDTLLVKGYTRARVKVKNKLKAVMDFTKNQLPDTDYVKEPNVNNIVLYAQFKPWKQPGFIHVQFMTSLNVSHKQGLIHYKDYGKDDVALGVLTEEAQAGIADLVLDNPEGDVTSLAMSKTPYWLLKIQDDKRIVVEYGGNDHLVLDLEEYLKWENVKTEAETQEVPDIFNDCEGYDGE